MLSQPVLAITPVRKQHDFIRNITPPDDAEEFLRFRLSPLTGHDDLHRLGDRRIQRS